MTWSNAALILLAGMALGAPIGAMLMQEWYERRFKKNRSWARQHIKKQAGRVD